MTETTRTPDPIDPATFDGVSLRDLYRFRRALDEVAAAAEYEDAAELAMRIGYAVERAALKHQAEIPAESLEKFLIALACGVAIPDEDLGPLMQEARRVLGL